MTLRILSLDIGTSLGWARQDEFGSIFAGTLVLAGAGDLKYAKKMRMDRRLDIRVAVLTDWLENRLKHDWIVFEDVKWVSSQAWGHLYGSLRGAIWSYAHRTRTQIDCLDAKKLKLWTTGSGGADKPAMAAAALRRWPEHVKDRNLGDDAIDALALLMWAKETLKV